MRFVDFVKNIGRYFVKAEPKPRPRFEDYEIENRTTNKRGTKLYEYDDFLELYNNHPSVYSAASDIALGAASVQYHFIRNKKEVKDEEIAKVFKNPNPFETWFDLVVRTFLHLELTGNAFWEIVRDTKTQKVLRIFALQPDRVRIIPHPTQKVAGYRYEVVSGQDIIYDAEEILHLRYIDPTDEYWGTSSLRSSQNSIILDFYTQTWNKRFFKEGAQPGGALETDQSLSPQAYDRLLRTWQERHQGVNKSHILAILEEGLKYKAIQGKHSDMEFTKLREMTKDEIYEAMRVPRTWRTNAAEKKALWIDNILPKLKQLSQAINAYFLRPEEGSKDKDNIEFEFIERTVLAMVEEMQTKADVAFKLVSHGIKTINEVRRDDYGLGPVPWGDTFMQPVGLVPYEIASEQAEIQTEGMEADNKLTEAEAKAAKSGGLGIPVGKAPPNSKRNLDSAGGDRAGRSDPSQVPNVKRNNRHPEVAKAYVDPEEFIDIDKLEVDEPDPSNKADYWVWKKWTSWAKAAGSDERLFQSAMRKFFAEQLNRALPKIRRGYKAKKKEEVAKADTDPELDAILIDVTHENELLAEVYQNVGKKIVKKQGNLALGELGVGINFDMAAPGITGVMEQWTASRVTQINENTRGLMKRSLLESVNGGEDFEDAVKRLGEIFDPDGGISLFRARRIARTELITLTNQAKLEAAKQTGVVNKKMWVSQLLPTTRNKANGENHWNMHKVVIGIDEQFAVSSRSGTDHMDGPGDISASPENVVNCLCVLEFPPETEEFADLFAEAVERGEVKKNRIGEDNEMHLTININGGKADVEVEKAKKENTQTPIIFAPVINVQPTPITVAPPVIEVTVPEQRPADIKVDVHPANVQVDVPKQDAPIINVSPTPVEIKPADVNVTLNPEIKLPNQNVTKTIERDRSGKMERIVEEHRNIEGDGGNA